MPLVTTPLNIAAWPSLGLGLMGACRRIIRRGVPLPSRLSDGGFSLSGPSI